MCMLENGLQAMVCDLYHSTAIFRNFTRRQQLLDQLLDFLLREQKRESDLVEVCDGSDVVRQDSPVVIKVADVAMHSHIHSRSPLRNALRHLIAVCTHRPQQLA
jgi:hypothetical protein